MLERSPTHCVLRIFLSAALFALPLGAVLHRASAADVGSVGMGTRFPVVLETLGKRFTASAPGQTRADGFSFEVALLGISARRWQLVGRFLRTRSAEGVRDLLIRFGSLQLEGG